MFFASPPPLMRHLRRWLIPASVCLSGAAFAQTLPLAYTDAYEVKADSTTGVALNLLANDQANNTLPTPATLSITTINGTAVTAGTAATIAVTGGTVQVATDGSMRFVPSGSFVGTSSFAYTIKNAAASNNTATGNVKVFVLPKSLTADISIGAEDVTQSGNVWSNDTLADVTTTPLSINGYTIAGMGPQPIGVLVPISGKGTFQLNANGNWTFAPAANYSGAVPQITYTATRSISAPGFGTAVNDSNAYFVTSGLTTPDLHYWLVSATGLSTTAAPQTTPRIITHPWANSGGYFTSISSQATGQTMTQLGTFTYGTGFTLAEGADLSTVQVDMKVGTDDFCSLLELKVNTVAQPINQASCTAGTVPPQNRRYTVAISDPAASPPLFRRGLNTLTLQVGNTQTQHMLYVSNFTIKYTDNRTSTLDITVTPVNDPPVNTLPAGWTAKGTTPLPLTGLSIADPDAGTGSMTVTLGVSSGTLTGTPGTGVAVTGSGTNTITLNGSISDINAWLASNPPRFTAAGNAAGTGTVTLTMTTNDNGNTGAPGPLTDSDTAQIIIDPVPVAGNDNFTTNEDTPLISTVTGNDQNTDGAGVWSLVTGPANGTLVLNPNGSFTYTPNANWNGSDSFKYRITDATGDISEATVTITVTPVNDAPVVTDDSASVIEASYVRINVLANDSDPDSGDTQSISQINGQAIVSGQTVAIPQSATDSTVIGWVTLEASGQLLFVPQGDYNDPTGANTAFTYTAKDSAGGTATATVHVTVLPVNDPPVVDLNGGNLLPAWRSVEFAGAAGALTGPLSDGSIASWSGGGIAMASDNHAVANTDFQSRYGATLDLLTMADGQSSTLSFSGGTAPAGTYLVVTGVDGANASKGFQLASSAGVALPLFDRVQLGTDPITALAYWNPGATSASLSAAGGAASEMAAILIDVSGLPDLTITAGTLGGSASLGLVTLNNAYEDSYGELAAPVAIAAPSTTVTDVDDSNIDSATIVLTNAQAGDLLQLLPSTSLPAGITASTSSAAGQITVTLTAAANTVSKADFATAIRSYGFSNSQKSPATVDRIVHVSANDGDQASSVAVTTIHVSLVNDPPVNTMPPASSANGAIGWSTNINTPVALAGLSVADEDAGNGTITVQLSVTSGTLTASDTTKAAPVTMTTRAIAVAVTGSGTASITLTGTLADINSMLATAAQQPVFTPATGATGNVPLTMLTDDGGNTGTGGPLQDTDMRLIHINAPPVDGDETVSTPEDTPVSGQLLTGATDPDGDPLSVTEFTVAGTTYPAGSTASLPGVGSLLVQADGSYTFTPAPGYSGPVPVATYTVADGLGGTDTSTLTITVSSVNKPPVAVDDGFSTSVNTPITIAATALLGNDSDPDGDTLTITSVQNPVNGSVSLNGGSVVFTPAAGFVGTASFGYTIDDGHGGTASATVTITITAQPVVTTPTPVPVGGGGFAALMAVLLAGLARRALRRTP